MEFRFIYERLTQIKNNDYEKFLDLVGLIRQIAEKVEKERAGEKKQTQDENYQGLATG